MPRPCKRRRICALPGCVRFGPLTGGEPRSPAIPMSVDEFESIRLIDLEGLSQEQCARQMEVARTTAQAIYTSARAKLAETLVNGRELQIGGGQYVLCDGEREADCCQRRCGGCCRRHNISDKPKEDEDEDRGDL